MSLPFTVEQFFAVFERYNHAVWPMQVVLVVLALVAVGLIRWPRSWSGPAVVLILAALWAWMGIVYHGMFFAEINPLAKAFAGFSLVGAFVFAWVGGVRRRVQFTRPHGGRVWVGWLLVSYALVVYPAWLQVSGHDYMSSPTFGAPCPTTIFTIGVLSLAASPRPRVLFAVPLVWSLIGGQAAFRLGVPQDFGLIAAGVLGLVVVWRSRSAGRTSKR